MTAYVVFSKKKTLDQHELDVYAPQAAAAGAGHPVTPLAYYGNLHVLEGETMEGAVILSFPTMSDAMSWYDSKEYQDAKVHRVKGADYNVFLIEGVPTSA